jgi:phosphoserine phosphatase
MTRRNDMETSRAGRPLITLSAVGFDSPGLVSKITTRILELGGNILDVEESCRRNLFSIFLIIDFSRSECSQDDLENSLNGLESETGLKIMITEYDGERTHCIPEKEKHLVTVLGPDRPGIMAKVSTFFHERMINILRARMIARGDFFSVEMVVDTSWMPGETDVSREQAIEHMAEELRETCCTINQGVVIQSQDIFRKIKKLVVFDVESSLVQEESLRVFLEGIREKLGQIPGGIHFVDRGEDQFQALVENARSMKGIPIKEIESFSNILQLNPGSFELIRILKSMGFKIALLSSGFNFFIKDILEEAGVDYAFSNSLKIDENGIITGELGEPVITNETKNELLEFIMKLEGIERDQVIAVGDGSSRSHFIKNAGLSIAFKPRAADIKADGILSTGHITNVLYCLGIPKEELEKYVCP